MMGLYIFSEESVKGIDPAQWGASKYDLKGAFRQIGMVKGETQFVAPPHSDQTP